MKELKKTLSVLAEVLEKNASLRGGIIALTACLVAGVIGCAAASAISPGRGNDEPVEETVAQATDENTTDSWNVSALSVDAQAIWKTLCERSWESSSGSYATFADGKVTYGGQTSDVSIEAVETVAATTEAFEDGNEASPVTHEITTSGHKFVLYVAGEPHVAELTEVSSDDKVSYELSCAAFGSALAGVAGSDALTVTSTVGEEALSASAGDMSEKLTSALRDWCTTNAPTATVATWEGATSSDVAANTTTLELTLNNSASTKVSATLYHATGEVKVTKSVR